MQPFSHAGGSWEDGCNLPALAAKYLPRYVSETVYGSRIRKINWMKVYPMDSTNCVQLTCSPSQCVSVRDTQVGGCGMAPADVGNCDLHRAFRLLSRRSRLRGQSNTFCSFQLIARLMAHPPACANNARYFPSLAVCSAFDR